MQSAAPGVRDGDQFARRPQEPHVPGARRRKRPRFQVLDAHRIPVKGADEAPVESVGPPGTPRQRLRHRHEPLCDGRTLSFRFVERQRLRDMKTPDDRAPERRQMAATAERDAQVAGQGPYVEAG